jgi:hypothetical protein
MLGHQVGGEAERRTAGTMEPVTVEFLAHAGASGRRCVPTAVLRFADPRENTTVCLGDDTLTNHVSGLKFGLGLRIGCLYLAVFVGSLPLQSNGETVSQNRPRPLPSTPSLLDSVTDRQ